MAKKDKKSKASGPKAGKKADKAPKGAKADKAPKAKAKAKGGKKVHPVPHGLSTVTPNLVFKDTGAAIAFYQKAFGAKERSRMMSPDGKSVWHAEIRIGDAFLYMNDESPMGYAVAPHEGHRTTFGMQLYVKDCDAWLARAAEAGAKLTMPAADMFWGDRMGIVVDPFGIQWAISTRIKDLSEKQMIKAGEEFARSFAAQQAATAPDGTAPQGGEAPSDAPTAPAEGAAPTEGSPPVEN